MTAKRSYQVGDFVRIKTLSEFNSGRPYCLNSDGAMDTYFGKIVEIRKPYSTTGLFITGYNHGWTIEESDFE